MNLLTHLSRTTGLLASMLWLVCASPARAGDAPVRWAFVTNFAKYTEWPSEKWSSASAPMSVCLLAGDRDMAAEISSIEKLTIAGHPVKGVPMNRVDEVERCSVLFIPIETKLQLKPIFEAAAKHHVLTVSDRTDFVDEGGMIGLSASGGRYVFDVSLVSARAADLKLSSQLLKLARVVK